MGDRDNLPELQKGWVWVTLQMVANAIDPQPSHRTPPTVDGGIPYVGMGDVGKDGKINLEKARKVSSKVLEEHRERYRLTPGDFIFGKIGTLGKPVKLTQPFNYALSANVVLIQPKSEYLNPTFAFTYMVSRLVERLLIEGSRATTQAAFGIQKVRLIPFPLPPLAEQHRMVAKIEELFSELDAGVELLKKLKAKLKRYRQAVLKAAVEGKLTKDWREVHQGELEPASVLLERILKERREKWEAEQLAQMKAKGKTPKDDSWKLKYKEAIAPDISDLPELPKAWVWVTVEQVVDVGTGATPLRSNPNYYELGTIPWVTSGALNEAFVTQADERITELAIQETNAKVFPVHTLLVAMYGEGKTRGKVSELLIEAATNQACAALLFDGIASVTRPYIKIYFQKNYDDIRRLSSGGVQPNLNLGIIKATRIPLPPLEEQKQIVEELERIFSVNESLEKTIDQNLKRAEKLRQSILKKAFEGKLVPQDPTDEPADKLLERIKAEKAKREIEAKVKKKRKQPGKSQQLKLF